MNFKASLLYAGKLIFQKNNSGEKSNGHRSLLGAMICIGISLIPLVAILVISNGMIEGITGRIIGLSTRDISIYINGRSPSVRRLEKFTYTAKEIETIPGVKAAYPEIQGIGLAAGKTKRTGASIRAVQNDLFTADENFSSLFNIVEGTVELKDSNDAIIGKNIADSLSIHAGDKLKLITINSNTRTNITPKVTMLNVKGIVSSGYQELDALWVFIPLQTGFKILPQNTSQFVIGVKSEDAFSQELYYLQQDIIDAAEGEGEINPILYSAVYRWDEMNTSQFENFASTQALLLLIMLLIVLVASVNISSALVMLVMERRKEIAILKSVGASSDGISTAFLFTGFAAGAGGVLIGIPIGLLAAVNVNTLINLAEKIINLLAKFFFVLFNSQADFYQIHLLDPAYYLQNIPITIPFDKLMIIACGTLVLSLIVSAVPAIKAGKEKPLDTLRKL